MQSRPLIIGIAGISGSGKSTVAEKIQEHFGVANCEIISSDFYYKNGQTNFDVPESLEFDFLARHLQMLTEGKTVNAPQYEYSTHTRKNITKEIKPKKIIIVDGILILHSPELKKQFNMAIFVSTNPAIAVLRRIDRDIRERGRDFAGAKKQILETVIPNQVKYVLPYEKSATLIVTNDLTKEEIVMAPVLKDITDRMNQPKKSVSTLFSKSPSKIPVLSWRKNKEEKTSDEKQKTGTERRVTFANS